MKNQFDSYILMMPLLSSSRNYIINWGDNSVTKVIDLIIKESYKTYPIEKLFDGAAFITYPDNYMPTTDTDENIDVVLSVCIDNELKNINVKLNDVYDKGIIIQYSSNTVTSVKLFNFNTQPTHIYKNADIYYIKIQGGITGFNSKDNNAFYKIERDTKSNLNIINIESNEINQNINGQYKLLRTTDTLSTYYFMADGKQTNQRIEISPSTQYLYYYNDTNILTSSQLVGQVISRNSNTIQTTLGDIEITPYYNENLRCKLIEILSWGYNTNWQTFENAFYNAQQLQAIPETQLPNVNNFNCAFYNCISLQIPNLSALMPPAAIYTQSAFLSSSISGDISNFVFSENNTVIDYMFSNITSGKLPQNFVNNKFYSRVNCFGENTEELIRQI